MSRLPAFLFCFVLSSPFGVRAEETELRVFIDEDQGTISALREDEEKPILTNHARPDFRPYIHPVVAPDGRGVLTQYSPGHHRHQTGLYWGFTRVNGRDYFHHPKGDYWQRKSMKVIKDSGASVQWHTVYDLLDANGKAVLTETQTWEMRASSSEYVLDLVWKGTAIIDITVNRYSYGGLFLRMPWKRGIKGEAVNASGRRNGAAEGKRDVWVDVGMQVAGRDDLAHIAIFDHPKNKGFPLPWRVDGQLGVGPVRARLGSWSIEKGESETIRHRFIIYTGDRDDSALNRKWSDYTGLAERPVTAPSKVTLRPSLPATHPLSLIAKTIGETNDTDIQKDLLRGMLDGLGRRRNVAPPAGWAELQKGFAASKDQAIRDLSRKLSQIFGFRE
ncbi:MAG: PmoA family protein [Planctomycetota bacterium]|jgi:hypothetical protein|nr:PmoA family protein [Planctomycetota bacterium]